MPWYEGPCRITVVGVDADWPQRVVVSIRRGATVVVPGTVGASELIDDTGIGHGWDLAVEHQYEGSWRPNVRAVLGKWTELNGVRSQLIRSKDHDWAGRDNRERNLVIRIDRADAGGRVGRPESGLGGGLVDAVRSGYRVQGADQPASQPVAAARRVDTESAGSRAGSREAGRSGAVRTTGASPGGIPSASPVATSSG
ncbi:hypothetical protein P3T36_001980 [Kitasatospora sp. MAP12-15]|uniref:hypothetical protein n=1 Tax=unclassified Kitasatospora TaxID=2633591 RepID=UPI0024751C49|nr:hypothetical protein [Kitasatospora sp. MAP12-44]MDH6111664.1 hypothetical protein [Kitasatospora sp. MAP12-44]